jgi:Transposase IS116/IS110/IS902 family
VSEHVVRCGEGLEQHGLDMLHSARSRLLGQRTQLPIGVVPKKDLSSGKVEQNGLSEKGDRYLRSHLLNGAMAILQRTQTRPW